MPQKRVFIAVLDWGLGHSTRMIPVIHDHLGKGDYVILGGSGISLHFLANEFPELETIELPGIEIRYSATRNQLLKLILQYPRMRKIVREENQALQNIIDEKKIDLVISDNRYGLYTDKVPCIFITHQLNIKAGLPGKIVNRISHRYIKKFTECHLPDFEASPGLAGELSHPKFKIPNVKYIGPLSRFKYPVLPTPEKKFRFIAVISGPEPQRTLLEEEIKTLFGKIKKECIIVRGTRGTPDKLQVLNNIFIYDCCSTKKLRELFDQSESLIARSGYSTIMDLHYLKMPAILIPTPGQKEQEYLGELHRDKYKIIRQGQLSELA